MIFKSTYFPNKEFSSKEKLFVELKANIDDIISLKRSSIQKSSEKGVAVNCKPLDVTKLGEQNKAVKLDENYYYIAVNTTLILDSHQDMHDNGIWNKSVKEQQGKNYLVEDHELEICKTIVRKEHIEMLVLSIPFSLLGFKYEGNTQALVYKFPKNKVLKDYVREWLDSGDSIEASVRMQYVTMLLAMDSNAPEDETEKGNYDKYVSKIANKSDFEYIPYFFIIKEAKNISESSLVINASNHVTGQVTNSNKENKEADIITSQKIEPSEDTRKAEQANIISKLKFI